MLARGPGCRSSRGCDKSGLGFRSEFSFLSFCHTNQHSVLLLAPPSSQLLPGSVGRKYLQAHPHRVVSISGTVDVTRRRLSPVVAQRDRRNYLPEFSLTS